MATGTDMSNNILQFDYNYGNSVGVGADENCFLSPSTESSSEKKSEILQLRFKYSCINRIPDVVYTGIPIGQEGSSIEVVLIDVLTGKVVKSGSEASAEVEILVLDQNAFDKNDNTDTWTAEEFEACILEGRYGKASLLGRTRINLAEGCGSLNDIFFSHTKHPLPNLEVRLGARLIRGMGSCHGAARIREAVSSPFTVKDRRSMNKKDYKLSRTDKVSRLKNIGKDGPSHKNLRREGIEEVGHFLNMHMEDPGKLKNILEKTMSPEKLRITINHAITCEHEHIPLEANHHDEKLKNILAETLSPEKLMTTINHAMTCEHDRIPLEANHDDSKLIINYMDSFQKPFDILGQETTPELLFWEELFWNRTDTDTIIRAFCNNDQHQQFVDPFNPFQSSKFCSSADLKNLLQGLMVGNVSLDKAQSQKRWKMLFSIFRWLSIRRVVTRKQSVLGIKRCRQE